MNHASQEPLYVLAEKGVLPDHQVIDIHTYYWLMQNYATFLGVSQQGLFEFFDRSHRMYGHLISRFFSLYQTSILRSLLSQSRVYTIHGYPHHLRVAVSSYIIAVRDHIKEMNPSEAVIAGMLHDVFRDNDKADEHHAIRAAEWYAVNYQQVVESVIVQQSTINHQAIINALRFHDVDDPQPSLHLRVLKKADAIDRFRLPRLKWWPHPARQSIPCTDQEYALGIFLNMLLPDIYFHPIYAND